MGKCMTANEIADGLAQMHIEKDVNGLFNKRIQNMLRQQQAEIEALKANRKHDFGLGEASGFIKGHKENPYKAITNTKIEPTVVSYTHPVKDKPHPKCDEACMYLCQMRELTDEEIYALAVENGAWKSKESGNVYPDDLELLNFARAILRKASEK